MNRAWLEHPVDMNEWTEFVTPVKKKSKKEFDAVAERYFMTAMLIVVRRGVRVE